MEITECPVCNEDYVDPKILPCAHLLCRQCLERWMRTRADALCPLCRSPMKDPNDSQSCAEVAASLPTDYSMSALVESDRIIKESHVCYVHGDVVAVSLCLHCSVMLCQTCAEVHSKLPFASLHVTEDLATLTPQRLASTRPVSCSTHLDKTSELFCTVHNVFICQPCATSAHRACPEVKFVNEVFGINKEVMSEMEVDLSETESAFSASITHLEKHVTDTEKSLTDSSAEIDKMCNRLVKSVNTCRSRLKRLVQDANNQIKTGSLEHKTSLSHKRRKLISHLLLIKRVQQTGSVEALRAMVPGLKSRIAKIHNEISQPPEKLCLTTAKLTFNQEALITMERKLKQIAEIELELNDVIIERTKGTATSSGLDLGQGQPCQISWSFHRNHGVNVVLSNNDHTAELQGDLCGIVMSGEPLKINTLYEVRVDEIDRRKRYNLKYVMVGVTTEDPATLPLPNCGGFLRSVYGVRCDLICDNSKLTESNYGRALNYLRTRSRVGILIDQAFCLHLYIDGEDQGVACRDVKQPCHAMINSFGVLQKITILPLTYVSRTTRGWIPYRTVPSVQ